MNFATDYLAQLEAFAERAPLPPVRALHLPPPPTDNPDDRGEFCALELADGSLGLSYVLLDDTLERLRAASDGGSLAGSDALALARRYATGQGIDRTLGFAAANALTRCLYDRTGFRPPASADSIGELDPQPGEAIGMIGYFKPLLGRVLASGARLTIVELKVHLAGEWDGYRVTLDPAELAACRKVLSTSTILLNDTLDTMLGHCRQAERLALIGPTAGCLPDALFARGVTFLGGTWVTDGPAFVAALLDGGKAPDAAAKVAVTPANYPGFADLLARL